MTETICFRIGGCRCCILLVLFCIACCLCCLCVFLFLFVFFFFLFLFCLCFLFISFSFFWFDRRNGAAHAELISEMVLRRPPNPWSKHRVWITETKNKSTLISKWGLRTAFFGDQFAVLFGFRDPNAAFGSGKRGCAQPQFADQIARGEGGLPWSIHRVWIREASGRWPFSLSSFSRSPKTITFFTTGLQDSICSKNNYFFTTGFHLY